MIGGFSTLRLTTGVIGAFLRRPIDRFAIQHHHNAAAHVEAGVIVATVLRSDDTISDEYQRPFCVVDACRVLTRRPVFPSKLQVHTLASVTSQNVQPGICQPCRNEWYALEV